MADPWQTTIIQKNNIPNNKKLTKFEDNFVPDKLPDHAEYLAILEAKLRKLKSDPGVLKQLQEKREACMRQLLATTDPDCNGFDQLEEPVTDSSLLRTLVPGRQAQSRGEIVEFIEYDQLIED